MLLLLSLSTWAVIGLLVFCLVKVAQRRGSPLSLIPDAAFGASYSRFLWAFPTELKGEITLDLPKIHEKLGPLVRIGPNEVSYYSLDVYDAVHKVGSMYEKDPRVYGQFVQDGTPSLFSTSDPKEHSKRRRLMGRVFNRSHIQRLEGLMIRHVTSFIQVVREYKHPMDLAWACRALEADIIQADFSFGQPLGAVKLLGRGDKLAMVSKNDEKATWMPLLVNFPSVWLLYEKVESLLYSKLDTRSPYKKAMDDFDQWCEESGSNALAINVVSHGSSPNLIATLVKSGLPPSTALSEAKENLGPGTDTTSASLAHILWALAHNEAFQESLFQDLSKISFSADMTSLESIPRLRGCVKEGIRWTGAAAAMLPRIVPPGGVELHGKFIPEGTVLTSSPIWYLRDPTAFPQPELFNPYRWITADGAALRNDPLRDRFYIPFSKGPSTCVGQHFAYLELYISLAQIIRNFRLKVQPTVRRQESFLPLPLPARKEWVAAVLTNKLFIEWEPRD